MTRISWRSARVFLEGTSVFNEPESISRREKTWSVLSLADMRQNAEAIYTEGFFELLAASEALCRDALGQRPRQPQA